MRRAIVIQPSRCKTFGPLRAAWPPIHESSPQCLRGRASRCKSAGEDGGFRAALFASAEQRKYIGTITSASLLDSMPIVLPIGRAGGEARCQMIALVLEVYGAFSVLSLIAFLRLASVAKLRSDLDEEAIDVGALEKVTKLASSEQSGNARP